MPTCIIISITPNAPGPADNKAWDAADPTAASKVDGLFGNFGITWARGFKGYSQSELATLPRVTTETGAWVGGAVTEELHASNLINMYLAQFKRGYSYTSVYLLRDRTDEGGDQTLGFFAADYTPRRAALYLHNLTTILADKGRPQQSGKLEFAILRQPDTVHDLLLQRSDGAFQLVVWGERLAGQDHVTVQFPVRHPSVKIYDPTLGAEPVQTLTDITSIDLTLSDHPIVIVIPPL